MNYDAVEISKRYYVAIEKGSGKTKTLSNKEHKASELPRVMIVVYDVMIIIRQISHCSSHRQML